MWGHASISAHTAKVLKAYKTMHVNTTLVQAEDTYKLASGYQCCVVAARTTGVSSSNGLKGKYTRVQHNERVL